MTPATFLDFRKRLGLSQARAAKLIGVSRDSWGRWERGDGEPDQPRTIGLAMSAAKLGLPPFQDLPQE